ncbi:tyrosine phosphatase-like protein [Scheffersomyces amazonensis]|uniref:tyrosine phosphatase-like protein n=1 Tax=Scheffersomyces amazonensis TaxID=1078765 RepID=UPI00315CC3D4
MSRLSNLYLIIYNSVSTVLWVSILTRSIKDIYEVLIVKDPTNYYLNHQLIHDEFPHKFLVYTQLFNSILELIHSLLGLVRSTIPTLIVQAAARSLITLGICYTIPTSPGNYNFIFFNTILWAWSLSDIIRYTFFVFKLIDNGKLCPRFLLWLRYSAFLILYPLGLISESATVYLSLSSVKNSPYYHYYFLIFGLSSYIPGFYFLYGHMLKQRKKVLGRSKSH